MSKDFLPRREADLVTFTLVFATRLQALATLLGIDPTVVVSYLALQDEFGALYNETRDSSKRTPARLTAKDEKKALLVAETRKLARQVQANSATTDEMRRELGLTIRKPEPTPEPVPGLAPKAEAEMDGHRLTIRLIDAATDRRARPDDVSGAHWFIFIGDDPPKDPAKWTFMGGMSRVEATAQMPLTLTPGTKVFITACWVNRKLEAGPGCEPVGTQINYGGTMTLKRAA